MNNPTPPPCVEIRITKEDWHKLLDAEAHSGYKLQAWEIGSQAVHDWLARNSPQTLSRPHTTGYQWKELFLPKGTLLRTVFGGQHHHCIVEDDGLRFNGAPTSPSRFANAVGGVRRNAWRVVWVLFPNTTEWKLADRLRTKRRAPSRCTARPGAAQDSGAATDAGQVAEEAGSRRQPHAVEPAAGGPAARRSPRQVPGDSGIAPCCASADRRIAPRERRQQGAGPRNRGQTAPGSAGKAAQAATVMNCSASPGRPPVTWHASWCGLAPRDLAPPA